MGLKLGPCTCSILIRSGLARWWTGRRKVVPHAVENKKNRAQSKALSKVDGIIANPSGNSWPEFDSPKKSKYVGNRMMERGYFATVFPDEGCLANPRWRMSCKWCQIVKFSCCATFPWPSQNSKTFLLHFDLFHLTSKTFLFLRFDLYLVVPFNLCYLHIVLSMV